MAKILRNLEIHEVSSVNRGAGRGVKVMLMKRDSAGGGKMDLRRVKKLAKQIRKNDPARVAKRTLGKVAAVVADLRRANPGLSGNSAIAKMASMPEHAALWWAYREAVDPVAKLGGGNLPFVSGNGDLNRVRSAPIPVIDLRPQPVRDVTADAMPPKSVADLVELHLRDNPGTSTAKAYDMVLKTRAGLEAYNIEKSARLFKSAAATGSIRITG